MTLHKHIQIIQIIQIDKITLFFVLQNFQFALYHTLHDVLN